MASTNKSLDGGGQGRGWHQDVYVPTRRAIMPVVSAEQTSLLLLSTLLHNPSSRCSCPYLRGCCPSPQCWLWDAALPFMTFLYPIHFFVKSPLNKLSQLMSSAPHWDCEGEVNQRPRFFSILFHQDYPHLHGFGWLTIFWPNERAKKQMKGILVSYCCCNQSQHSGLKQHNSLLFCRLQV